MVFKMVVLISLSFCAAQSTTKPKPNFLFVLADDFGHYDVGWRNPEVTSPTLDMLARSGIILNRHYVYKYCSPTRSSFLSGRLPIHVNTANRPTHQNGGVDLRMTLISEKLKTANYSNHVAGKWHGGGYTFGQLPTQRGFDSHLGYLNGMEDHYTQIFGQMRGVDLWLDDGPAFGMNGTYGGLMYVQHMVNAVRNHQDDRPLFLYMPFQNTHVPLEVPEKWLKPVVAAHPKWSKTKQTFQAMVSFMDEGVKNVTDELKAKGLWNNTIVVFSADNGGEQTGGGSNYPFRGGKYTDFEGGTRVSAFVSGGSERIPDHLRGTSSDALVHVCDWYATFCSLAGVDPVDYQSQQQQGIPPLDSLNVWPAITHNGTVVRKEVPLSTTALVSDVEEAGRYKIVTKEKAGGKNMWVGKEWPDGNKTEGDACNPCLFDLATDPYEHVNLATDPKHKQLLSQLQARLQAVAQTQFQTGNDGYKGNFTNCTNNNKGFFAASNFISPVCYPCLHPPCSAPPSPPSPPSPSPIPGCSDCVQLRHTENREGDGDGDGDADADTSVCIVAPSCGKQVKVGTVPCADILEHTPGYTPGYVAGSEYEYYEMRQLDVDAAPRSNNVTKEWLVGKGADPTIQCSKSKMCLRPINPPRVPASCKPGHGVMVGENACMRFNATSGTIFSPDCAGLCLVVRDSMPVLGDCNSPDAKGWTTHA